MQTDHAKTIKGLSIATIVMSSIAILGCVIGFFALGVGGFAANTYGPDAIHYSQNHVDHSIAAHMGDGYYGSYAFSEDDLMGLLEFALVLGAIGIAWELLCAIVSLVAGIIGLRGANVPERLGRVFGWGIAGAVAAFLSGRVITCVLLVIAAVYASKDKNAPKLANGAWSQAAPTAQPDGAWGAAAQPGATWGAPVQPGATWGAPGYGYGTGTEYGTTPGYEQAGGYGAAPSYGQPAPEYGQAGGYGVASGYSQPATQQPAADTPSQLATSEGPHHKDAAPRS